MAPASLVLRVTPRLVAGYDTYGFSVNERGEHDFPEVIEGILQEDYPGGEFWLGGKLVKDMNEELVQQLADKGTHLGRNAQNVLTKVAETMFYEDVSC